METLRRGDFSTAFRKRYMHPRTSLTVTFCPQRRNGGTDSYPALPGTYECARLFVQSRGAAQEGCALGKLAAGGRMHQVRWTVPVFVLLLAAAPAGAQEPAVPGAAP